MQQNIANNIDNIAIFDIIIIITKICQKTLHFSFSAPVCTARPIDIIRMYVSLRVTATMN